MKKIAGLYQSYLRERNDEIQEISTGGEKMEKLTAFLKEKLNADDYFTAEELLNELVAETEEKGFTAGCKYTSSLAKELFTE